MEVDLLDVGDDEVDVGLLPDIEDGDNQEKVDNHIDQIDNQIDNHISHSLYLHFHNTLR